MAYPIFFLIDKSDSIIWKLKDTEKKHSSKEGYNVGRETEMKIRKYNRSFDSKGEIQLWQPLKEEAPGTDPPSQ